jgi:hypothetical protein
VPSGQVTEKVRSSLDLACLHAVTMTPNAAESRNDTSLRSPAPAER